jgi:hypothetical protein
MFSLYSAILIFIPRSYRNNQDFVRRVSWKPIAADYEFQFWVVYALRPGRDAEHSPSSSAEVKNE